MLIVQVSMTPGGDFSKLRTLAYATITNVGVAREDRPDLGVKRGERAYRVRLFKDAEFGGPTTLDELRDCVSSGRKVWREFGVRGHMPGPRGVWDLVGGALREGLGSRLNDYRRT